MGNQSKIVDTEQAPKAKQAATGGVSLGIADPDDAAALLDLALQDDPPASEFPGLRLHLGLPRWITQGVVTVRKTWPKAVVSIVSALIWPLELVLFWLLLQLPESLINKIMVAGFQCLVRLWALLPKAITLRGVHDDMSMEAHLMSIFLWPARLLPMNLMRLRYGMCMRKFASPAVDGIKEEVINVPEAGVKGLWLHTAPKDAEDPPVFMWIFGGACFAGDVWGDRGIATRHAKAIGADVFLVDYRLLPEHSIEEGLLDGCRAYEWLLTKKAPSKIYTGGISAGAGVLLRALQAAASTDPKERSWAFHGSEPTPQPAGALLMGPFVDFRIPAKNSSMIRNAAIDWIVTQGVIGFCAAHCVEKADGKQSKLQDMSPLLKDLRGLCPILITYSLHEAVTDQCNELVSKLKVAGNDVEAHTVKYLGHVFQALSAFLPEAKRMELIATSWLVHRREALTKGSKPS